MKRLMFLATVMLLLPCAAAAFGDNLESTAQQLAAPLALAAR